MATQPMVEIGMSDRDDSTSIWYSILLDHLSEFTHLAWCLVADPSLVEWVVMRSLMSLSRTEIPAGGLTYCYARALEAVVLESFAVLKAHQPGLADAAAVPSGELPDVRRIESLLKRIWLSQVNQSPRIN